MHSNKLVVAIKTNGKVLREFKDEIRIPFGCEYSIYIKNLNTVRALVKIEIDGRDVGDGTKFIVQPNSEVEIERFIINGNMNEGNRFKFIERNAKVEESRGIQAEDGLVRVSFQFEKPAAKIDFTKLYEDKVKEVHHHHYPTYPQRWYLGGPYYGSGAVGGGSGQVFMNTTTHTNLRGMSTGAVTGMATGDSVSTYSSNSEIPITASACNFIAQSASLNEIPVNDAGITVEGSVSDQKFQFGSWFDVESESHAIVLKLIGNLGKQKVEAPVTVKSKQKCKTCKHVNKATAKFCSECGTSLTIV